MSTFSTLRRRSASLIATSAFDWLSPSTWTILYLPSTSSERELEVASVEDLRRDRGGDPEELLLLVDLLGERHRVGARVDTREDVDLLDVEETLRLVDRDLGLRLAVAVDLDDLVLAEHELGT